MAEPEENGLVKSVEGLLSDKQAMAAREKKLIEGLNAALGKLGYKVVRTGSNSGADGPKKPGRPPGSGKAQAPKAA